MEVITNNRNKIHPQIFALWASMLSITMMFGGLISAYIVKQAAGNWLDYTLPWHFYLSTLLIIGSSVTLHLSYNNYKLGIEKNYKVFLICSFVLGVSFIIFQYQGWTDLFSRGVDMKGNVSGAFFYLISGLHAVHVLGGIAAITVALIHAFSLKFEVKEFRRHRFDLVLNYWHFMGFVWIVLMIFLVTQK